LPLAAVLLLAAALRTGPLALRVSLDTTPAFDFVDADPVALAEAERRDR
jgi:hypothetical protein